MTSPSPPIEYLSLQPRPKIRWRLWIILWSILALSQITLLANNAALDSLAWRSTRWFLGDNPPYNWAEYKFKNAAQPNAPFYQRVDPPMTKTKNGIPEARVYKRTEKFWRLMRDLGEPYMTALLIAVVVIYDRRRWKAGAILLTATALAGGISTLIRVLGGRFRPDFTDGANLWQVGRGFFDGSNLSWPSGHSTLAFATAAVLTYFSPRGRWLFIFIAANCAIARVVMTAHFWSDAIMGSILGWTLGWFITVLLDRLIPEKDLTQSPTTPALHSPPASSSPVQASDSA
jgi:membrane-associated phospholipid phosphatase